MCVVFVRFWCLVGELCGCFCLVVFGLRFACDCFFCWFGFLGVWFVFVGFCLFVWFVVFCGCFCLCFVLVLRSLRAVSCVLGLFGVVVVVFFSFLFLVFFVLVW